MVVFAIVIYNIVLTDCITLSSFFASQRTMGALPIRLLVLDNSIESIRVINSSYHSNYDYYSFGENVGLARAYKHAVDYCQQMGAAFIVTLDQDSIVTCAYIETVVEYTNLFALKEVALCPRVICQGRQISPFSIDRAGLLHYRLSGELRAINSFSVYSVSVLTRLKIIDEFYWLDGLDFVIFEQLHLNGIPVIAIDVDVHHNLSLINGIVDHRRLAGISYYETVFLFEYCGPVRLITGLARLLVRVLRRIRFEKWENGFVSVLSSMISGSIRGLIRRLNRYLTIGR